MEAKVRAYVPVVSLAKVCDLRTNDATSGDHRAMLEAVKSDPNANKLAYRVHYETQTAYIKARDGGQRVAFCKDFIAANSQYAKARFTAVVEDHMSDVSTSVQKAIAHNVCGALPVKLSKADWKPYALIKKMLQNEQKLAKENAETNGWNVTEKRQRSRNSFARRSKADERFHAAALSSLSAPRATILIALSGNGRCSAFASSHGARILWRGKRLPSPNIWCRLQLDKGGAAMPHENDAAKQQRIGERLTRAMAKAHMNRNELAELTGYSVEQIVSWERGRARMYPIELIKLCHALDVKPEWLLCWERRLH